MTYKEVRLGQHHRRRHHRYFHYACVAGYRHLDEKPTHNITSLSSCTELIQLDPQLSQVLQSQLTNNTRYSKLI